MNIYCESVEAFEKLDTCENIMSISNALLSSKTRIIDYNNGNSSILLLIPFIIILSLSISSPFISASFRFTETDHIYPFRELSDFTTTLQLRN